MNAEKKKYYDRMMAEIPDGLSKEDWEAEILDDIAMMDQPSEVLDVKFTVGELDRLIDEHEAIYYPNKHSN